MKDVQVLVILFSCLNLYVLIGERIY